jgi:hypothetical protein
MTNWKLARRDLLKSLGVGVGVLPLLRATNAFAAGPVKRFMVFQMSEGLRQAFWKPPVGSLMTGALPATLQAFEKFRADMTIIPGLNNPGGGGGHGSYGCVYYGLGGTGGGQYKEPTGKTVDQIIANALPKPASGHLSVHYAVQFDRAPTSTGMPGGRRAFWAGAGAPINPVLDPIQGYMNLFTGGEMAPTGPAPDPAAAKRLIAQKKSILDYVGSSLDDFSSRLGKDDKAAIEHHHESIRQLETQIATVPSMMPSGGGSCGGQPMAGQDFAAYSAYPNVMKAQTNLMVAALKCGVTNVATIQTGDSSGNNINFGAFVPGLPMTSKNNYKSPYRNWHDLGHNPVMDGTDHKKIVDRWFMDRWAEVFEQMRGITEEGGTLFDNTVTLVGNHVEEGANHNSNAIPWMVFGKGWGSINAGNCIGGGGKVAGVMAGICKAFGVTHPYGAPMAGFNKA